MSISIEEQLRQEGVYVSTTSGVSMWPMLRNRRDRVILRAKGEERLKRWDLPLYRYPDGRYVLHRVIAVKDGYYVIRGDNTYSKEKIPEEWILGVVTEFYRGERHVMANARGYRFYAALWQSIYPLRYPLHMARCLASRIKHRLWKKKK
ncbi:MAG: S24/S26 family peptidase [Clostridia bacterium]|nr:S24/S26 family peptidase [Clostridia bacterium]